MSLPDDLRHWRDEFLAAAGIGLGNLADDACDVVDEACAARAAAIQERVPARYAHALVTDQGVRSWMAAIVQEAISRRRAVVSITSGPSLLLLGPTGTGKTFQAYGALRGFAVCGLRGPWRAISAADLYARLRPRHGVDSEAEFEKFAGAGLLVLDDLGVAKGSEWVEEVNYRLVNHRYEYSLPTLFTSNVPPRDLAGVLGERVSSRLTEMAGRVTLKGADRRRAA